MVKQSKLGNTNTGAFLFSNTKSCMNGGSKGYGVTMDSLRNASNAGLGRGYTGAVTYKNCGQGGGAMALAGNHDMANSYGYVNGDDKVNNMFRGSYAPVTPNPTKQSCSGGAKKKRRRKRRKSRKTMKNKKRSRYSKSRKRRTKRRYRKGGGRLGKFMKSVNIFKKNNRDPECAELKRLNEECLEKKNEGVKLHRSCVTFSNKSKQLNRQGKCTSGGTKRKKSKKPRKSRKSRKPRRRRRRKNMKGGSTMNYSVINSGLKGNDARILGSHSYTRSENCGDGYNHFTGGQTKSLY